MVDAAGGNGLVQVLTLLGAAVVAVPVFRKLGLGSVLGYLAAGMAIGPFGLGLIRDDGSLLHIAELGVVMFLFIIGLEMRPSHLWSLRRQIFGLGSLQILVCGLLLTGVGLLSGFSLPVSFVSAMGFVLTSTAIVVQILSERGDIATSGGQKVVSVLLFEDLLIVPLLAIVAFLAPAGAEPRGVGEVLQSVGLAVAALAALIAAGLWLLNPLFRILARAKAREVMTAAALLVVLGAAVLMEQSHLSMAMGAFLAGVLLSESSFRHQLEADIEPFRGLLLGLFFLAVGLSLRLDVVLANWQIVFAGVVVMMLVKGLCIYGVARLLKSNHREALDRAILMAQGGEFAFVLYQAASQGQVIDAQVNANMTAIIVLSMVLTPLVVMATRPLLARKSAPSLDGVEQARDLKGSALIIGFGRVGQVASQGLLASGAEISIIDNDPEVIRNAQSYGFKVYYGDGTRAEVLHAAGIEHMQVILICVDDKDAASRMVENVQRLSPQTRTLVRAWDREHAVDLIKQDADVVVRETFESAMRLGREAVRLLGASDIEADDYMNEVRCRDAERLVLETTGGLFAGRDLILGNLAPKKHD